LMSANFKAEVQKGLTKAGAYEIYPVLELALPSGTKRYCAKGVSSDARGNLEARILEFGTISGRAIDLLTNELGDLTLSPLLDYYAPIIYGVHNSNGSGGKGFVPCYLVDSTSFKYLVALGHLNTVTAVYENGTLVGSGSYTVGYETVKGALFTKITFTSGRNG